MTLQQKLAQADDYLDMLKDKAKETDELAKENLQLRKEIERLNNIIGKAIGLIYDYQMNDEENVNYKELLYVLKGVDKE